MTIDGKLLRMDTELTDDGRAQIEATLRKRKADLNQDMVPLRMALLRDEVGITIHEDIRRLRAGPTKAG